MNKETSKGAPNSEKEWKPDPPESFEIEFTSPNRIGDGLLKAGFQFTAARPAGENKIIVEGKSTSGDGTKIEVVITKGDGYKSPKELAEESAKRATEDDSTEV